jgi:hypothetical protein
MDPDAKVVVIGAKEGACDGSPRWVIVNYDLLAKHAGRLRAVVWAGVILRLGQKSSVTVEYMLAAGTLNGFIAELLEAKMRLIQAVEADTPPGASILRELEARLRAAGPALLAELLASRATGDAAARIETIAAGVAQIGGDAPIAESGMHEFVSSRDPREDLPRHLGAGWPS